MELSQTRTPASVLNLLRSKLASEPYLGTEFKPAKLALDAENKPYFDAAQIKVGVRNRVVRLTGLLPSEAQRDMA